MTQIILNHKARILPIRPLPSFAMFNIITQKIILIKNFFVKVVHGVHSSTFLKYYVQSAVESTHSFYFVL